MAPDDGEAVKARQDGNLFIYTVRKSETVRFTATLRQTPFDIFTIPFNFELTSRALKPPVDGIKEYRYSIHVNLIDFNSNMCYKADVDKMPEFDPAFSMMKYELLPEEKNEKKTLMFQYAPKIRWDIGLYRDPLMMILTIFMPIFVINIIGIAVFWQDPTSIADQLANLATLVLAILAYMPVFRQFIPTSSQVTLGDKILGSSLFADAVVFFMIMHRYRNRTQDDVYVDDLDRKILWLYFILYLLIIFSQIFIILWKYILFAIKRGQLDKIPKREKRSGSYHKFAEWVTLRYDTHLNESEYFEVLKDLNALEQG